jgi:glycosyltransferase WbpL
MMLRELALFLATIALSATATWQISRRAVGWGLLDVPNVRSSHTRPTPRGGGLAIVFTVLAAAIVAALLGQLPAIDLAALIGCGGAVAAIGYCDDLKALSAPVRFVVHLLAAAVATCVLVGAG